MRRNEGQGAWHTKSPTFWFANRSIIPAQAPLGYCYLPRPPDRLDWVGIRHAAYPAYLDPGDDIDSAIICQWLHIISLTKNKPR
ncbi:uncharacterized protein BO95DRAFT_446879 [Aspergillus brunneoviolaceus CBS 621.78]|uniref:Uncharacterized protein n=1 Tax=Aspergillus brunneoviolaceus CBS 621.78 TaxID=1450534 RepID=A0ACD1FX99_9EURO|nr:hypothetical protein BO95DRAFT_446879 [Aspergillus brunneoviolaceus CBS 621.78]RAH41568.1 hypothetical protein BO95DRAFT_446879 [Aspergillus brunneoviolaceus CBS 621.78]